MPIVKDILRPTTLVGTLGICNIQLLSNGIGPVHCTLTFERNVLRVYDLRSNTGTWVNGQRIDVAILTNGDRLTVGDFDCAIETNLQPQPAVNSDFALADHTARLVIHGRDGRAAEKNILRPATLLGSLPGCNIQLIGPGIVPVHCFFTVVDGRLRVRDLRSATGTRVNGQAATVWTLRNGDRIDVGPFQATVQTTLDQPGSDTDNVLDPRFAVESSSQPSSTALLDQERLELSHARESLAQTRAEIAAEQQTLFEDRRQIDLERSALAQDARNLQAMRVDLENERHGLDQGIRALEANQKRLDLGRIELEANRAALASEYEALDCRRIELEKKHTLLEIEREAVERLRCDAERRLADLEEREARLSAERESLDDRATQRQEEERSLAERQLETETQRTQLASREEEQRRQKQQLDEDLLALVRLQEGLSLRAAEMGQLSNSLKESQAVLEGERKALAAQQQSLMQETAKLARRAAEIAGFEASLKDRDADSARRVRELDDRESVVISLWERSKALEANLAVRESDLTLRQLAVAEQVRAHWERSQKLEKREAELEEALALFTRHKMELAAKEATIADIEKENAKRSLELERQETTLNATAKLQTQRAAELEGIERALFEAASEQSLRLKSLSALEASLSRQRTELEELQRSLDQQKNEMDRRSGELELRSQNLVEQQARLAVELESESRRRAEADERDAALAARASALDAAEHGAQARRAAADHASEAERQKLAALAAGFEQQRDELERAEVERRSAQADIESRLRQLHEQEADLRDHWAAMELERKALTRERRELEGDRARQDQEIAEERTALAEWNTQIAKRQEELATRETEIYSEERRVEAKRTETESRELRIRSEEAFLRAAKRQFESSVDELRSEQHRFQMAVQAIRADRDRVRRRRERADQVLADREAAERLQSAGLLDRPLAVWFSEGTFERSSPEAMTVAEVISLSRTSWIGEAADSAGTRWAIKCLRKRPENAGCGARLQHEARIIRSVDHPNVLKSPCGPFLEGNDEALVMSLLPGVTLEELIDIHGALPWREACNYMFQAALGIGALHGAGIVHRRIDPTHLMVDRDGGLVVVGLSRAVECARQETGESPLGQAQASEDYLAPECFNGAVPDPRADIYSLGCSFYRALTASAPFAMVDSQEKREAHRSMSPPTLRSYRRRIPSAVVSLVNQMMAKDPRDRPASVEQISRALAPWARRQYAYFDRQAVLARRADAARELLREEARRLAEHSENALSTPTLAAHPASV